MPRSYSERDVVERYVDLQAVLVGASPSLRSLARSLSLSAPAVYRYFGSIERLQKAALPSIADRLIKDAHRTEGVSVERRSDDHRRASSDWFRYSPA